MPRAFDGPFDGIASFEALHAAALRAVRGKRRTPVPAAFLANLETETLRLERRLQAGTWRPGSYVEIEVTEPKRRVVSAAPFRDRVVHHAVHAVVAPLFERGFIHHNYANRVDKGTHRAVACYERLRNRYAFVLRGDMYRYFPAIDHEILKADLRQRIACRRTLAVLDRIIDGSNPQEPVHLYYAGDDLFTPYERRRGLPIGNLIRRAACSLAPSDRGEDVVNAEVSDLDQRTSGCYDRPHREEAQSVGHSLRLLGKQPLAPTLFHRFANLGRFVAPYAKPSIAEPTTKPCIHSCEEPNEKEKPALVAHDGAPVGCSLRRRHRRSCFYSPYVRELNGFVQSGDVLTAVEI